MATKKEPVQKFKSLFVGVYSEDGEYYSETSEVKGDFDLNDFDYIVEIKLPDKTRAKTFTIYA